ncbi:alpha/beta fold hydrolase [Maricaulis parjimensis]|uniref:alpha/beta fold hydrolase n=1 Tax=Maricaulis parjimensis TaxID=144023 RepID=UPI00193A8E32|nr:alpha/beta hydrolase [Maricaulis parjimensis]
MDGQLIEPEETFIPLADGEMAVRRWVSPGKPVLLFAHANGFCGSAYTPLLAPLAGDYEIIVPDLRGHGRSRLPANPDTHRSWDIYARDLLALIDTLERKPDIMAGHSMGAVSSLLAASQLDSVPRLILIEPVVMPPSAYLLFGGPLAPFFKNKMPIARQARRRRNGWPDREAALARYGNHPTFKRWAPGMLEAYLLDGLAEQADGTIALACDPAWEAANYEAQGHDIGRASRKAASRASVLKAEFGSTVIRPAALTGRGASLTRMDGVGHLAPMEAPDRVRDWLKGELAS